MGPSIGHAIRVLDTEVMLDPGGDRGNHIASALIRLHIDPRVTDDDVIPGFTLSVLSDMLGGNNDVGRVQVVP